MSACARQTRLRIFFRQAIPGRRPGCWVALPAGADPGGPTIVAVHGIRRGAKEQAQLIGEHAARCGRVTVAPVFDIEHWAAYQRIGRRRRADLALISLLQALQAEGIGTAERFTLFGFSAGAQFAHRFAMLAPQRIERLCIAAAGWYTFPDRAAWPYGLGPPSRGDDRLARAARSGLNRFLQLPIEVCIGSRDNHPDATTRSGPRIDAQQGPHRLARAQRWVDAVRSEARHRGIAPHIALTVLDDVGHAFRRSMTIGRLGERIVRAAPGESWHLNGPWAGPWTERRSLPVPCRSWTWS